MGAVRAVSIITGEDANARPRTIVGLPVQTLHLDPAAFVVEIDSASNPSVPRVIVRLASSVTSALSTRVETLENAENAVIQPWATNVVPMYEAGQKTRQLADTMSLGANLNIKAPTGDGLAEGHTYTLIVNSSTGWTADLDTSDWKGDLPIGLTGAASEKMVIHFVWTGGVPVVVAAYSGTVA